MIDETWYRRPQGVPVSLAAGGVVVRRGGDGWLVALVREAGTSRYILPKGRLDAGETAEEAARREIQEEAGLDGLQLLDDLGERERLNFKRNAWKVTRYFLFLAPHPCGRPTDRRHAYRCEWFSLEALPVMLWPEQRSLVEEAFRRLAAMA